jgi:hypothetical protein
MPVSIITHPTNPSSDQVLVSAELTGYSLARVVWRYAASRAGLVEIYAGRPNTSWADMTNFRRELNGECWSSAGTKFARINRSRLCDVLL